MKHNYIMGIIWTVVAFFLTVLLIFGIISGSRNISRKIIHIGKDGIDFEGDIMAGGKMTHEEILDGEVQNVEIEVSSLAVGIVKSNDGITRVRYFSDAEKYAESSLSGGLLSVKQTNSIFGMFMLNSPKILLSVPDAQYETIKASATSGAISISDLRAGSFNLKATSGAVKANDLETEDFCAETSSGSVKIDDIHGKKAVLNARSGAVKASDVSFDEICAETSSGAVSVSGKILRADLKATSGAVHFEDDAALTGDSSFRTTSGAVKVELKPSSEYYFETSVTSGILKNSLDSNRNGSVTIKASATSGMVKISGR